MSRVSASGPALTTEEVVESGRFLLRLQEDDGALPWFRGGQWDAWNHTEALMGLTVSGVVARTRDLPDAPRLLDAAHRGLEHLRTTQRADGSWPMSIRDRVVEHDESDTNQCAYPAVGVWHSYLATGDQAVLDASWAMVEAAIEHVLRAQRPDGTIAWAVNARGRFGDHALLTGNASILQSLWSARAIADALGITRPHWSDAGHRLARAVAARPELFTDRRRYSMDWFYPVLGGALVDTDAQRHLEAHWDRFVWDGYGVRCVDDHPWVTGGESAELVMALTCLADTPDADRHRQRARVIMRDISRLRATDGGYWTGYVVDDAIWPQEQTGWTVGALLLAADALDRLTPAGNFFHPMTWSQEHV